MSSTYTPHGDETGRGDHPLDECGRRGHFGHCHGPHELRLRCCGIPQERPNPRGRRPWTSPADDPEEEEAGEELTPLTREEKKELKRQLRRHIFAQENGAPHEVREELFREMWNACNGHKPGMRDSPFHRRCRFQPPGKGDMGTWPEFGPGNRHHFGGRHGRHETFGEFPGPRAGVGCGGKWGKERASAGKGKAAARPTPLGGFDLRPE
jgi:hypothetical protein